MRSSRFTYSQILAMLKQNEEGAKVPDLCQAKARAAVALQQRDSQGKK